MQTLAKPSVARMYSWCGVGSGLVLQSVLTPLNLRTPRVGMYLQVWYDGRALPPGGRERADAGVGPDARDTFPCALNVPATLSYPADAICTGS